MLTSLDAVHSVQPLLFENNTTENHRSVKAFTSVQETCNPGEIQTFLFISILQCIH